MRYVCQKQFLYSLLDVTRMPAKANRLPAHLSHKVKAEKDGACFAVLRHIQYANLSYPPILPIRNVCRL